MDVNEVAAMTEASGLTDNPDRRESLARAAHMDARDATVRLSEQLRRMTLAAPLTSLFVAFLFGVLVARRR